MISSDIDQSNVLVLKWYDETNDRYAIWANGVELYWGCFPWNHKKLPFWIGIGEPIHHQLLWGKSLPDKLMGMQDINNAVFNAMLDQLYLALNSPVFIDGMANIDEGYLEPGRIYEVDPGDIYDYLDLNISCENYNTFIAIGQCEDLVFIGQDDWMDEISDYELFIEKFNLDKK